MAAQIDAEQQHNDHLQAPIINGLILLVVFPRGRPPRLRARPAPKRGLRRERLDWHIDTRKKLKAGCFLSCTRVQRRFSCLLSLSSRDSQPLPLSSPNEDSFPEPILSESQPRSTPSIVVHTQSVRKERPWKKSTRSSEWNFSSSDNSKTSDGNPWLSCYGWKLLLIAQGGVENVQYATNNKRKFLLWLVAYCTFSTPPYCALPLNAITTRSDHGLMGKWRQKFIRTGMRIFECKNIASALRK